MKYIKIFMLLAVISITCACSNDDLSSESIFDTTSPERNDFDKWLLSNYTNPYNIEFNYLYNDKLSDNQYNVVPAGMANSKAMALLLKHVWLDAYTEVAGEDFVKSNTFRVIQLIGSPEYSTNSSIVLGTAEGGIQVTLFRINELDINNIYVNQNEPYRDKSAVPLDLNYWYFHTMHHEFCHILTQQQSYSTDFQTISAGKYHSTDWINVADTVAPAEGFVSGYASGEYNEDFAELFSTYVTSSPTAWQQILDRGVVVKTDASGAPIYAKDAKGNYIYLKDANGNLIPETDANGSFVPVTDSNGDIVYARDANGNYVYYTDASGKPYPMYDKQTSLFYTTDANGKNVVYFIYNGKLYSVKNAYGSLVYQKTQEGNIIYDKSGNPVPEYFKVPMFEYKKSPEATTTGRDAILSKLEIVKNYFKDSWKINLDTLRTAVLRRSTEASTLDLKNLI